MKRTVMIFTTSVVATVLILAGACKKNSPTGPAANPIPATNTWIVGGNIFQVTALVYGYDTARSLFVFNAYAPNLSTTAIYLTFKTTPTAGTYTIVSGEPASVNQVSVDAVYFISTTLKSYRCTGNDGATVTVRTDSGKFAITTFNAFAENPTTSDKAMISANIVEQ